MKTFEQKPEKYWWTQSPNYTLYALREFSGILIAIWAIYTVLFFVFPEFFKPTATSIIHTLGLTGAIIHTLTWLWTMPKLLPQKISGAVNSLIYATLIMIWLGLSSLLILWI